MKRFSAFIFSILVFACTPTPSPAPETPHQKPHHSLDVNANNFELVTFLADTASNRLGILAHDAQSNFGHAIFIMPELVQEQQYEDVLVLKRGKDRYVIGTTQNPGVANAQTSLCENEYAAKCTAQIHMIDGIIASLDIQTSDQTHFSWQPL